MGPGDRHGVSGVSRAMSAAAAFRSYGSPRLFSTISMQGLRLEAVEHGVTSKASGLIFKD